MIDPDEDMVLHAEGCLSRVDAWDSVLRAVITRMDDEVRAEVASQMAASAAGAPRSPLAGMLVAVKDNIDTRGTRTTAGSDFFRERVPEEDAFVIARLREAGAIPSAKVNLAEFALGATTQNAHWGSCRNAWDQTRIPGGSSGGSAVAVAAGMADASLGTDTGGSVRIPASVNGLVGLRPTLGRISNRGVTPLSLAFDTVGPMAHTARLAASVFSEIDAFDFDDPSSQDGPRRDVLVSLDDGVDGLRIGVPREFFFDDVDPAIAAAVRDVGEMLAKQGGETVPVRLDGAEEAQGHMFRILYPEVASFHAQRLAEAPQLFGEDVHRRLQLGVGVDARDMAVSVAWRRRWQRAVERVLLDVDVILTPTVPVDVPHVEGAEMIRTTHEITRFTYGFSMYHGPSISIPCGFHPESGMPIGAHLTAAPWREDVLFRAAAAFQSVTDWHERRPAALEVGTG
ncbi:amidase [Knoellia sp. Soil729]|uniref:amidase n=1 Tax=Knoellia sp. Soil729 TaxID=1736394 RepID=UPI000AD70708|nr:amidase [Knoellia sp. Soil729]